MNKDITFLPGSEDGHGIIIGATFGGDFGGSG